MERDTERVGVEGAPSLVKVTAEVWVNAEALMRDDDLGWEVGEDRMWEAEFLVRQAVDCLSHLVAFRVKARGVKAVPRAPEVLGFGGIEPYSPAPPPPPR